MPGKRQLVNKKLIAVGKTRMGPGANCQIRCSWCLRTNYSNTLLPDENCTTSTIHTFGHSCSSNSLLRQLFASNGRPLDDTAAISHWADLLRPCIAIAHVGGKGTREPVIELHGRTQSGILLLACCPSRSLYTCAAQVRQSLL